MRAAANVRRAVAPRARSPARRRSSLGRRAAPSPSPGCRDRGTRSRRGRMRARDEEPRVADERSRWPAEPGVGDEGRVAPQHEAAATANDAVRGIAGGDLAQRDVTCPLGGDVDDPDSPPSPARYKQGEGASASRTVPTGAPPPQATTVAARASVRATARRRRPGCRRIGTRTEYGSSPARESADPVTRFVANHCRITCPPGMSWRSAEANAKYPTSSTRTASSTGRSIAGLPAPCAARRAATGARRGRWGRSSRSRVPRCMPTRSGARSMSRPTTAFPSPGAHPGDAHDGSTGTRDVLHARPGAIHGPGALGAREWWVIGRALDKRSYVVLACGGGAGRSRRRRRRLPPRRGAPSRKPAGRGRSEPMDRSTTLRPRHDRRQEALPPLAEAAEAIFPYQEVDAVIRELLDQPPSH